MRKGRYGSQKGLLLPYDVLLIRMIILVLGYRHLHYVLNYSDESTLIATTNNENEVKKADLHDKSGSFQGLYVNFSTF